jgi:hypothetical protein
MEVTDVCNYDMAAITAVKTFIVHAPVANFIKLFSAQFTPQATQPESKLKAKCRYQRQWCQKGFMQLVHFFGIN